MKQFKPRNWIRISIFLVLNGLLFSGKSQNDSFAFPPGERLTYNMKFGWFTIGEAEVWLDPEWHYPEKDGKPHYSLQVNIKTANWFRIFSKLDVCVESLIEAEDLIPHRTDIDLKVKGDLDVRHDYFTYADSIYIKSYQEQKDRWKYYQFTTEGLPLRDAMSTFVWFRRLDRSSLNEEIKVRAFLSALYEFNMRPGKETTYKFNGKKMEAMEFALIFPESKFFKKSKESRVIVSGDENRWPLRVEINMKVGSFVLNLDKVDYIK